MVFSKWSMGLEGAWGLGVGLSSRPVSRDGICLPGSPAAPPPPPWVCSGKLESFAGFYDTGTESSCLVCLLPAPKAEVLAVTAGRGTWRSQVFI